MKEIEDLNLELEAWRVWYRWINPVNSGLLYHRGWPSCTRLTRLINNTPLPFMARR